VAILIDLYACKMTILPLTSSSTTCNTIFTIFSFILIQSLTLTPFLHVSPSINIKTTTITTTQTTTTTHFSNQNHFRCSLHPDRWRSFGVKKSRKHYLSQTLSSQINPFYLQKSISMLNVSWEEYKNQNFEEKGWRERGTNEIERGRI